MGHNSTTWVGQKVLPMTISHAIQVGRRWSIPVPHGWAEGCSLLPFLMPHRSARDGPYQYHMGGLKGAPYCHSSCHTGQPEMELHPHISHYLYDFSEASNQCYNEINWLTSNTQSISSWASVSMGQSAQSWSQSRSWMYPHLLEFLHDFYKASSQCYNWIIEINWIIERNWSITAQISISVGPLAQRILHRPLVKVITI